MHLRLHIPPTFQTLAPRRLLRSSLNFVCVFPMMSTGTLLFLVQIQGGFGSKLRKNSNLGDFVKFLLVNTISPDCLVRSSSNSVCMFPTMSAGSLLFLVQIQGLFGSKLGKKCDLCIILWNFACKHDKSRLPGPGKFKLGVCVPHDEYRKPIVFGADPRSFWVKT